MIQQSYDVTERARVEERVIQAANGQQTDGPDDQLFIVSPCSADDCSPVNEADSVIRLPAVVTGAAPAPFTAPSPASPTAHPTPPPSAFSVPTPAAPPAASATPLPHAAPALPPAAFPLVLFFSFHQHRLSG